MVQRLVVSDVSTGFETDRPAFMIKNDAFPTLNNAYIFRGRIFRKRGDQLIARLERELEDLSLGNSAASPWTVDIFSADGLSGLITNITNANPGQVTSPLHNLMTGDTIIINGVLGMTQINGQTVTVTVVDANNFTIGVSTVAYGVYISGGSWTLSDQPNLNIVPGSVVITIAAGPNIVFTDQGNGTLTSPTGGNSATINYVTGIVVLTHTAGSGVATTVSFSYYPNIPVMGIEDFNIGSSPQPIPLAFDTTYSYEFDQGLDEFYDTTFYKATQIPFTWNGTDYEQFWSVNYQGNTTITNRLSPSGCIWVTNGNPGFHFLSASYVSGTGTAVITFTFTNNTSPFQTLVVNDILWFNEWSGMGVTINGISGTVTAIVNASTGTYAVTFVGNQTVSGTGIAQMLTNFLPGQDGIRWYDGDPTASSPPNNLGWVNFAPPLSVYDSSVNPNPNYLVGANMIFPFKNRLLMFGVYQTTSGSSAPVLFYPNRVVYSQVGTPFYTLPLPNILSNSTPAPVDVAAWYQTIAGRGGFIAAPIDDQIVVVVENEDVLLTIFETQPLKLIYRSDDTLPFIFQTVSAEFGALSTFSGVKLDSGVLSVGVYGLTQCDSTSTFRIDLKIPDQVFDFSISDNDPQRVCAIRDYQKEWVYFTYCPNAALDKKYPSKTLLYNYRENNWATLDENYTTYGTFRRTTFRTWASIDQFYPTWSAWTDPWNFGASQAFSPVIVGGNQQGFVMQKGLSTAEEPSQFIQAVSGTLITSPNHGLNNGDFIQISGMIGSTNLNGTTQLVSVQSANTFSINNPATGTYLGGGVYNRVVRPQIQTKQFPVYWEAGRGVRLGTSRFLLQANSQPKDGDITAITQANPCQITSIAHGLSTGAIISIYDVNGMVELNDQSFVIAVVDVDNFTLNGVNSTFYRPYLSGGEWELAPPQITVYLYSSQNANNPSNNPAVSDYIPFTATVLTCAEPSLYTNAVPPYEAGQDQIWHRLSPSVNGDTIQLGFTLSDAQMSDPNLNQQEITIHAIVLDLYPGPVLAI